MTKPNINTQTEIAKYTPEDFCYFLELEGCTLSFEKLENYIDNASKDVQKSTEYAFYRGILFARLVEMTGGWS